MADDDPDDANKQPEANGTTVTDLVIPLRKPIMAHGDEIKQLTFREPTAGDIEACGSPVMVDFNVSPPKMTYETKAMFAMMSRLAGIPPSSIKMMNTKDWEVAALYLAHRFFTPE